MLHEHTKVLMPLAIGDMVQVQNQCGANPLKWERSSVVVEVKDFEQYVIRMDYPQGTGSSLGESSLTWGEISRSPLQKQKMDQVANKEDL